MKVISILGSPRKKGNTAKVLDWVEAELQSLGQEVDRVTVVNHKIAGCLGCRKCKQVYDEMGCVQKDDASTIYEQIMAADAILWAAPLFTYGFPSQLKALLDRGYCLTKNWGKPDQKSLIQGKKNALLITCDGAIEGNASLLVEAFKPFTIYHKMISAGNLVIPFCRRDPPGDAAKAEAEKFANQIAV